MNATKEKDDSTLVDVVWGAKAIGQTIGLEGPSGIRKTYHLLENGYVPARKIGDTWVSTRSELHAAVRGELKEAS